MIHVTIAKKDSSKTNMSSSSAALRLATAVIVLGTIGTTLHLASVILHASELAAAHDSLLAHDADDGTGGEKGLPIAERTQQEEGRSDVVKAGNGYDVDKPRDDDRVLVVADPDGGMLLGRHDRARSRSEHGKGGRRELPLVQYPNVSELTSLAWYHTHFNDTRYRAASTQREVYWGRPKVHGRCAKTIFAVRGSGFQLMTMHGPILSVEQKLVETFMTIEDRRRIITAEKGAASSASCSSGGVSTSGAERLVMDLGVNDGEDTVTWYHAYGRANESCTKYVLLEPQQNYAHNIHCAVEKHYFASKLSAFPKRRVLIGQVEQSETGNIGLTDLPVSASPTVAPKFATAPCGNLTLDEWEAIKGKRLPGGLVDATKVVFPSASMNGTKDGESRRAAEFIRSNRILYFKAAAATMPNQHLTSVVMSGSGEQAAVVVKAGDAAATKGPSSSSSNASKISASDEQRTTLLSLSELYQQLTTSSASAQQGSRHLAQSGLNGDGAESLQKRIVSLSSNPARISLLKIDCEGADPSIVMGAWELFAAQRVDVLIIEAHKNNYMFEGAFPFNYTEAVAMLRFYGYRTFLVGFFHAFDSFVFLEVDAAFMMLWRPNLETIVALPGVPLDGKPFLLYQSGIAKRMTKKLITGFFIASSRMNVETSNYWGRVRNEGHYMSCLMNVYLVKCPVCGGERPLRSKKKYGG